MKISEKKINAGLLIAFILFAFYCALKATRGLIIPVEQDNYRDMSIAENMLHGFYTQDQSYKNELFWYNPLVPALNALIAKLTGLPLNIIVTHAGKFLNLLIPVSIYYMGLKLFNRKTALAIAAASTFFVCGNDYCEHTSGYTYIWLALCFSQILFYLAVVFANKIMAEKHYYQYFLLGIFTGILFLCHSATSFLFCVVLICMFIHSFIKKEITFAELIIKGMLFSVALLLIASPLLYSIFVHYHFKIKSINTTQYVYYLFEPAQRYLFLKETFNVYFVIAMVGLVALVRSKNFSDVTRRLILYWFFGSLLVFLYLYFIVILRLEYNINLPGFVPSQDVFFCVKSAEAVLIGIGFYELALWFFAKFGTRWNLSIGLIFYLFLLFMVTVRLPSYARRKEYNLRPNQTRETQRDFSRSMNVYSWLKKNTDINDVVLCEVPQANFPVMASGRKMVATYIYYTSPYVSFDDRKRDADSMFAGLQHTNNVQTLLNSYGVKYLLLPVGDQQQYPLCSVYFPQIAYIDSNFIVRKHP